MYKKLMLFTAFLSWSNFSHAFSAKRIKLHVLGHIGGSSPSMQFSDKPPKQITNNFLFGGGGSIQLFQSISIDISGSRFWPNYAIAPKKVLNAEGKEMHTPTMINKTNLFDVLVKKTIYTFTPHNKVYLKGGLWYLRTIENVVHADNTESTEHNIQPLCDFTHKGYGVAFGPGVNWRLAPRALPALSADVSAVLYFPTPTLGFLRKNAVSGIFPVIKGGANWNIW